MKIKDRKRTRFNKIGVIRLGIKVFWCKDGHKSHPTRWNGKSRQACEVCGNVRNNLTDKTTQPYQPGHFVLWDAPEVLEFYQSQGIEETEVRELDIMFPFADRDKNFIAAYQVWAGGDIVCEGDGEYVTQAIPTKTNQNNNGRWSVKKDAGETLVNRGIACRAFDWNGSHFDEGDHVPCGGSGDKLYPHCNLCKLNSMLKVMMSDPSLFRMGYYRIATGSGRNYDHLDTMFSQFLPENVQGIYFKLRLVEEETRYTDKDGKDRRVKKWFLHLEPDPAYMRDLFKQRAGRQIGQGAVEEVPQLTDGTNGEYDEVIEEFNADYPDDGTQEPDAPPPDDPGENDPDFSDWKPRKWGSFCALAAERFDCFQSADYVWPFIKSMHGNPPEASYDEVWASCAEHDTAPPNN
jgi:hypothetical protein